MWSDTVCLHHCVPGSQGFEFAWHVRQSIPAVSWSWCTSSLPFLIILVHQDAGWWYRSMQSQDSKYLIINDPAETFYNDLPADVSEPWISQMRPQAYASFQSTVESVCWESGLVPCTYLMCELDQGIYPPLQKMMLENVTKEGHPWTIETCRSGHSAWLSQVPAVTRLIRSAAGEKAVWNLGIVLSYPMPVTVDMNSANVHIPSRGL